MNVAHRKRRIAADEAHSWARNLRLSNPFAKLVLSMLTLYVDGDGKCFVGIEALAEDTELSTDTVRKRLAWLEKIGAIARFPQWVDASGRRNSEEKGKRTTDEIRLLMASDSEMIERRAQGEVSESAEPQKASQSADETSVSPRSQQGLNPEATEGQPSVSPLPALCQPSDSGKGIDSSNLNLNPNYPLTPEDGGDAKAIGEIGSEPTWPHEASWARVEKAWDDPILHQQICRDIWTAFTDIERDRFIKVVRGYLAWRLKQPKMPNRCNIQKLMREIDAWPGYEKLAGTDPALRTFVHENSVEHRALQVIARIGSWTPKPTVFDSEKNAKGFWRGRPLKPDEIAMTQFENVPLAQWKTLERADGAPYFAWSDRVFDWTGVRKDSIRVPCQFPPRKDGHLSGTSTDPPAKESAA